MEILLQWIPLVASVVLPVIVYFLHERKLNKQQNLLNVQQKLLNKQQKQINSYELKKNKKEEANSKKAKFSVWSADQKIYIENIGEAVATDIKIEKPSNILYYDDDVTPPSEMKPLHEFFLTLVKSNNNEGSHTLQLTWSDDFKKNQTEKFDFQI